MATLTEHWAPIPERSMAQRLDALAKANDTRGKRARLKRDLKASRRSALDVLADPPEYVETMRILDLLLAVPKWGQVKATQALRRCAVSPSKTVGGLSARQRAALINWMRGA